MRILLAALLLPLLAAPAFAQSGLQISPTDRGTLNVGIWIDDLQTGETVMNIDFINPKTEKTQEHIDYSVAVTMGGNAIFGPIPLVHTSEGTVMIPVEFPEDGTYEVLVEVEGILFQPIPAEAAAFEIRIDDADAEEFDTTDDTKTPTGNGSCLIATAAFGSEMAAQVQQLREIRDGTVMQTESGAAFMEGFNRLYYSFSPAVADLERQSPELREAARAALAPMLASLSILSYASIDSEAEMLGYGIAIILLNAVIYVGIPVVVALGLRRLRAGTRRTVPAGMSDLYSNS